MFFLPVTGSKSSSVVHCQIVLLNDVFYSMTSALGVPVSSVLSKLHVSETRPSRFVSAPQIWKSSSATRWETTGRRCCGSSTK